MEQKNQQYPTEKQIEDSFSAWKKGGKAALLEHLRNQQEQRKAEKETPKPESGS